MGKSSFLLGRDPSADLPVADSSVSRIHAELTFNATGQLFVTDRQSSNGTFVIRGQEAPRRVQQETVLEGDRLQFGDVVIAVPDLIAALRRLGAEPAPLRKPRLPKPAASFPQESVLIRCSCGSVRDASVSPCPVCGAA